MTDYIIFPAAIIDQRVGPAAVEKALLGRLWKKAIQNEIDLLIKNETLIS